MDNTTLKPPVAIEGLGPAADDLFSQLPVEADLRGNVRVRMAVVEIPALRLLVELDQHLFVEPGRGRDVEHPLLQPLELAVGLLLAVDFRLSGSTASGA